MWDCANCTVSRYVLFRTLFRSLVAKCINRVFKTFLSRAVLLYRFLLSWNAFHVQSVYRMACVSLIFAIVVSISNSICISVRYYSVMTRKKILKIPGTTHDLTLFAHVSTFHVPMKRTHNVSPRNRTLYKFRFFHITRDIDTRLMRRAWSSRETKAVKRTRQTVKNGRWPVRRFSFSRSFPRSFPRKTHRIGKPEPDVRCRSVVRLGQRLDTVHDTINV